MQRRLVFSLVNIGMAVAVLTVLFLFPRYAGYAVYAFFGWFLVSLSVVWFAGAPARAPTSAGPAAGAASAGPVAPVARPGVAPTPPARIDFCIYCAADLPAGTPRCRSCGHNVPNFA